MTSTATRTHRAIRKDGRTQVDVDRNCLLCWRLFSVLLAIVILPVLHSLDVAGAVAIFGEHAGEVIEYVGEWFAKEA